MRKAGQEETTEYVSSLAGAKWGRGLRLLGHFTGKIHAANYLLSTCYVPGPFQLGDTAVSTRDRSPCPHMADILVGETDHNEPGKMKVSASCSSGVRREMKQRRGRGEVRTGASKLRF